MPKASEPTGFGERLKELREGAKMTQAELAARVGFHRFSVSKLELGAREPTWRTVIDLAAALGVTPDAFLPRRRPGRPRRKE